MKSNIVFMLIIILGIISMGMPVRADPFAPQDQDQLEASVSAFQYAVNTVEHYQQILKQKLVVFSRDLRGNKQPGTFFTILFLSFLYGIVHAIGPGHGKSVVLSYLLTYRGKQYKAIFAGAAAAFCHGITAIILVLMIYYFFLGRIVATFESVSLKLMIISYALIICIGVVLMATHIKGLFKTKRFHEDLTVQATRSTLFIVLSLGLVPCPGAMIILLFFLSLGLLYSGIWMALSMSVGMAMTMMLIGIMGAGAKNALLKLSSENSHKRIIIHDILGIVGSLMIVCLGSTMLLLNIVN